MPEKATLGKLSGIFFRIGNTIFGGGDPMMAALRRELVDRKEWLTHEDYGVAYALARITPGTNVLAFCAAIGSRILGLPGAIAGVLAVTVPSALLAVLFTIGYETWRTNVFVTAAIGGTAAAVAGMMFATVWLLIRPQWKSAMRVLVFFGGAFIAAWKFGITPVPIIGLAALGGLLWTEPTSPGRNAGRES